MRRRIRGGILFVAGYILSPLSWWNDLFVNIPLAYFAASALSLLIPGHFSVLFASAYLATNVLGFMLMHMGVEDVLERRRMRRVSAIAEYVIVSVIYTLLVLELAEHGMIKPIGEYLS